MRWFRRRQTTPEKAFLQRYRGRTVIVHAGFPAGWLEELLKQPGGGGHFRFDIRHQSCLGKAPIEQFIHRHIAPLALPLPLVFQVSDDMLYVRHLVRNGQPVHSSELGSMLIELPRRYHFAIRPNQSFNCEPGLAVDDNAIDYDHLFSDS